MEKFNEFLQQVNNYLTMLGKSRAIQINVERKLKDKLKEAEELLKKQ